MAAADEVKIRVKISSAGQEVHDLVMPYTSNVAALRVEIGQQGFALVDSRTGNVLEDSVLLGGLVDSMGEVRLEMLPMSVEVVSPAAGGKQARRAPSASRKVRSKNAGTAAVSVLSIIGGIAVLFVVWKIYSWYRTWKKAKQAEMVPASAPGAESGSAPPQAVAKAQDK
jgi:hypothetical protein